MEVASMGNPNMCAGCAQMLEDLSPLRAVSDLSEDLSASRSQDMSDLHNLQPLFVPLDHDGGLSAQPRDGLDGLSNAPGQRK